MKNSFYTTLFIIICVAGTIAAIIRFHNGTGTITVPNWEHGVVICGEAVVINHGHERDHEVKELFDLADHFCPKP